MKHVHAELMLQYAQDAMETEHPWERWEYSCDGKEWVECIGGIGWFVESRYRRKPKTININGFEVPEPIRIDDRYTGQIWGVTTFPNGAMYTFISNCENARAFIKAGLAHRSEEAAMIHSKALLSFTKQDSSNE